MKITQILESISAGVTGTNSMATAPSKTGKIIRRQKPSDNALDSGKLFQETNAAEGKEDKIAQLKKDHATAVHWSKNETSPQKREAARQKAEKIKRHLDTQYKQGVAEKIDSRFRKTEWIPIDDALKILKHYGATIEKWGGHFHFAYYDREGVRKRIEDLTWNADDTRNVRLSILNQAVRELKAQQQGVAEDKQKGVDGKACWKGYKRMGTKKKGGRTVDNCVKMEDAVDENKKGVRAVQHTTKPRNFVAKNAAATTSGAGAHKDKKKAMKQGETKHKGKEPAYESKLWAALDRKIIK